MRGAQAVLDTEAAAACPGAFPREPRVFGGACRSGGGLVGDGWVRQASTSWVDTAASSASAVRPHRFWPRPTPTDSGTALRGSAATPPGLCRPCRGSTRRHRDQRFGAARSLRRPHVSGPTSSRRQERCSHICVTIHPTSPRSSWTDWWLRARRLPALLPGCRRSRPAPVSPGQGGPRGGSTVTAHRSAAASHAPPLPTAHPAKESEASRDRNIWLPSCVLSLDCRMLRQLCPAGDPVVSDGTPTSIRSRTWLLP
jgi:hypothetical protein